MSKVVQLRNITVGAGHAKICVSIVGKTRQQILEQAKAQLILEADMVEWRADAYEHLLDPAEVSEVLKDLRNQLGEKPILFTIRTEREGGEIDISIEDYISTNVEVIQSGYVDMIDVEPARGDDVVYIIIETAHEKGIPVIASYRDYRNTPKKEDIIMRMCKMQEVEADIAKISVMPRSQRDVLVLLDALLAMKELHDETPLVAVAMGEYGKIVRICGEFFGSAITFWRITESSVPGQTSLETLKMCMDNIRAE